MSPTNTELSETDKLLPQTGGIQTSTTVQAAENVEVIKDGDNLKVYKVNLQRLDNGENSTDCVAEETDKVVVDKVDKDTDGDNTESSD